MEKVFNQDYKIDYMFLNEDLTASVVGLAGKVQETSLLHSLNSGYSMEWFLKEQCGFVLTGWNIEIKEYPKWGETINISTWPNSFKSMLAHRSFVGRDARGEVIFKADSDWVFMSLKDKKPLRISPEMYERYAPMKEPVIGEKIRMPDGGNYKLLSRSKHKVTRQDIDTNHHVNNISYIAWAMDAMDNDYYFSHEPERVMVKYNKESRLGEEMDIEINSDGDNFLIYIKSAACGELRCSIFTSWREK